MAEPATGAFSFFGNDPAGYAGLETRRKIVEAMLARGGKKGYPKTLGEGLTSVGDSIGEGLAYRGLMAQQAAYDQKLKDVATQALPPEARPGAAPPAAAPGKVSSYAPAATTPPAVAAINTAAGGATPAIAGDEVNVDPGLNEAEMQAARAGLAAEANLAPPAAAAPAPAPVAAAEPGVEDGGFNMIDASADFKRPTPGYMQDAIMAREKDPMMQAYYGSLVGGEAPRGPHDNSSTGAAGPFQFTRGTGKAYGLNGPGFDKREDLDASMQAAQRLTQDNAATFERLNGRPPTYQELALMHQQGDVTGARMAAGTGNASPNNLAVNNIPAGASPAQAVASINKYYGMPDQVANVGARDRAAAVLASREAPAMTAKDAIAEKRFADVIGMSKGDTGAYAYPPTAMARSGDVQSDAPNVTGISPAIGAAAGDTMQQRNDITRSLLQQQPQAPVQEVPQPNPTMPGALPPTSSAVGSPPEAANNRPIATDIRPRPADPAMTAGAQMAQAQPGTLPTITPFATLPQRPVPASPGAQPIPPTPPQPQDVPMTREEIQGYRLKAQFPGDPNVAAQADQLIAIGKDKRSREYEGRMKTFESDLALRNSETGVVNQFNRNLDTREIERQTKEAELVRAQSDAKKSQQSILQEGPKAGQSAVLGTPMSPQRTGTPTTPPVPPGVSPEAWAGQHAPLHTKALEAVEKAVPDFDTAIKTLNLARNHPGREWGVGLTGEYAKKIPGTAAYGFGTIMDQIAGKNFLSAYQQLRGGGAITEIEGTKAEAAQARLKTAQTKEDFDKAMIDFETTLRRDLETAQRKVNQPVTAWRGSGDNSSFAPDIGERRGDKEYIGGRPSDPMSWRRVR